MNRFKLLYFVIFIINLYKVNAQISDKRLCVDEECKVPISLAKTLLRYSSPDSRILSFAPNVDITIYSKSAGSREDLWGVEINGKRGYVPKHMVREIKVFQKPTLLVDTEFTNVTETTQVPSQVAPDKVQEPYEIVDGTTLYLNPQDDINPTSTESPIQSTALPAAQDESNQITKTPIVASVQDPTKDNVDNVEVPLKETSPQGSVNVENSQEQKEISENIVNKEATSEETLNMVSDEEEDVEDEDGEVDQEDDDDEDGDEEEDKQEPLSENLNLVEDGDTKPESDKIDEVKEISEPNEGTDSKKLENETEDIAEIQSETISEENTLSEQKETISGSDIHELGEANVSEEVKTEKSDESIIQELKENIVDSTSADNEPVSINEQNEVVNNSPSANITGTSSETILVTDLNDLQEPTIPNVEVSTIIPEIEMPQPFDDSFIEVTPNPAEVQDEVKTVKDTIPTLPPLGLFAASTSETVDSTELHDLKTEQSLEENHYEQNTSSELKDEPVESVEENLPQDTDDFSFKEDKQSSVEDHHDLEEGAIDGNENSGFFAGLFSMFGMGDVSEEVNEEVPENDELPSTYVADSVETHVKNDHLISTRDNDQHCDVASCQKAERNETPIESDGMDLFSFNSDILIYLVTTAVSVIVFLFGYIAFDKSKREGPLVAKINNLEKELLIVLKENQILQEKVTTDSGYEANDRVSNEFVEKLTQELAETTNLKNVLEEQVQSLEKELENSTEVGMELNRMLSEILSSEGGSDILKANVEHLQRQLVEQQSTINSVNETLAITNTENHELRLELELSNKKVFDLQAELDKLLLNILKIEEEKDIQQSSLEHEIVNHRQKYEGLNSKLKLKEEEYESEIKQMKNRLNQTERKLELKVKEYEGLTETVKKLKTLKNNDESVLRNLLENSGIKAELQLLKTENKKFVETLQQEQEMKLSYEKKAQSAIDEVRVLKEKYDEADKLKVEMQTKLEVLSNYFKDREAQWQKEISKHESLWAEKQGEATSTTERIKFMQEQLQNYKTQTESLKQEIVSQEIELKSQISVLEKKAHENWVSARQAERKLEETKQEAAQLRHRLTLRERAIQEDKSQHRLQSPIEQNGDMVVESPASPPLLYGTRDHITKSPPIPGLPPFLPPPPGVPFMPPPLHGVPPFIPPPPPNMFPGDHRPPPLGRMSSPPLNSRYSPSSRGYSPYDRNSSSPSDSEYGTSPPHRRAYSPFNNRGEDRRDYKRPPPGRSNGRNIMKGGGSSGSGNSNESLEKINRQQSKV